LLDVTLQEIVKRAMILILQAGYTGDCFDVNPPADLFRL
jgi:hypothetical protein